MAEKQDEFTIFLSTGMRLGTNGFDSIEGLREAIRESFGKEGAAAFSDGLSIRYNASPGVSNNKTRDYNAVINPAHVMCVMDNRERET